MYQAWNFTKGSSSITIGVLDSGTDWSHGDLGLGNDSYQNIFLNTSENDWSDPNNPSSGNGIDDDNNGLIDDWKGWNYALNTNDTRTTNFHGTFVAGIISGKMNNNEGIAGIAGGDNGPGIKALPYCIGINSPNSGLIDDAIIEAVDNGVRVIQLSLSISQSSYVDDAIQYAINNGVVVVCSSGNESSSSVGYPASNTNVISVGATDQNDKRASFSNYGNDLDVVAPGINIYSTTLNNSYTNSNGTSFSSPQISALAGLILCINPNLTSQEVRNILETTTDKGGGYTYTTTSGHSNGTWNSQVGYGRVNAYGVVLSAYQTKPIISGPTNNICTSNTAFFLQNLPSGVSVSWSASPSNLFTITAGTGTNFVTAAASSSVSGQGTITATVSGAYGNSIVSKTVWVGIPGTPVITGPNPLCYNQQGIYQVSGDHKGAESFLWSYARFTCVNNCKSNISAIGLKATLESGQVYVRGQNECGTSSIGFLYVAGCGNYSSYSVYPNPTADVLYINANSDKTAEESLRDSNSVEPVKAILYNFSGISVLSKKIKLGSAIDIKELPNGHYILHIEDEKGTEAHHIIVE